MKRNATIAILALVGIVALSTLTFAGPMGGMGGMRGMGGMGDCQNLERNPAVEQLTQEKRDLLATILDEHRKDAAPLHADMWEKRTLLEALSGNPNTKPETITALVREMSTLRAQMQAKRDALETRVNKEVGIELPMGLGMHDGGRGHGRHQGGFGHRGMGGMGRGMNAQDMVPAGPGA